MEPWMRPDALYTRFNRSIASLTGQVLCGAGDGYDGMYEYTFPIGSLTWRIGAEPVDNDGEPAALYTITVTAVGHEPSETELRVLREVLATRSFTDITQVEGGYTAIKTLP
jgi:hypothetical protein